MAVKTEALLSALRDWGGRELYPTATMLRDEQGEDDEGGKRGEIGEALYILLRLFTNECE